MRRISFIISFVLILSLVACGIPSTGEPPKTVVTSTTVTATQLPTSVPTPASEALIYIDRLSAWNHLREEFPIRLQDLAIQLDMEFYAFNEIPDQATLDTAALVVVLGGEGDVRDVIQPDINRKLLLVGVPDVSAADHVAVIGSEGMRQDQTAFLIGYVAGLVTDDWRTGIIGVDEEGQGLAEIRGFLNGVVFFCGLCRPAYPPFQAYPTSAAVGSPSTDDLLTGVDQLLEQAVSTIAFSHEIDSQAIDQVLSARANTQLLWIGSAGPQGQFSDRWIGTVRPVPEDVLEDVVGRLLRGEALVALPMPIGVLDVNPEVLSEGKLRLVLEIRDELVQGTIDTGVDPFTGQDR